MKFLALLAYLILFVVGTDHVFACSCDGMEKPIQQDLDRSSTVFSGEVIAVENIYEPGPGQTRLGTGKKFVFQVSHYWKGIAGPRITIHTGNGFGDCGSNFDKGKDYLIFATGSHKLYTNSCSRNRLLERAQMDLDALGPGSGPRWFGMAELLLISFGLVCACLLFRNQNRKRRKFEQ